MLPRQQSRPERRLEAADDCWAAVNHSLEPSADITRCTRCHRPLHVAESVRRELGPVCAVLLLEEVAA